MNLKHPLIPKKKIKNRTDPDRPSLVLTGTINTGTIMPARDLYNKILIDYYKSTKHRGVPAFFTHSGTGYNHNCGDEITVYLTVSGKMIDDASYEGKGCMICQASASILAGELKGKSVTHALRSILHLTQLLSGEVEAEAEAEVKFKVEKGIEYDVEAEVDTNSDIEAEANVETEPEDEVEVEPEIEIEPEVETGSPDYIALSGIREFPMRIKCATLAWETAAKLLQSSGSEFISE